jgi:hypothetical protein
LEVFSLRLPAIARAYSQENEYVRFDIIAIKKFPSTPLPYFKIPPAQPGEAP